MFTIVTSACKGLCLFLLGMQLLIKGLNSLASVRLKYTFQKIKINPLIGVFIGIFIASILQSSSSVTILLVGLVESNYLSLYQVVYIIMGVNIGTTITTQLIAFKIGKFIFLPLSIGIILFLISKDIRKKLLGQSLIGFSLIFIGIDLLSEGLFPLKDYDRFKAIIVELGNLPLLGILMGFCTTAIIQSSSAGIAILQSMASSHLISISSAVNILLGQNIGTCVTTLLSSISLGFTAKRTAYIHLIFNVLGVLIIFPFIGVLCNVSQLISPINVSRQIANAHSIFNIFSTIALLPFAPFIIKLSFYITKKS